MLTLVGWSLGDEGETCHTDRTHMECFISGAGGRERGAQNDLVGKGKEREEIVKSEREQENERENKREERAMGGGEKGGELRIEEREEAGQGEEGRCR